MAKRRTRTVVTDTEEIVQEKNPTTSAIRKFFDTGEYDPVLNEWQLKIRVQQWDSKRGSWMTLVGTSYTDLEGMMQSLGERYGNQRYKFYIMTKDDQGKQGPSAVVENYDLLWDNEEEPEEVSHEEVEQAPQQQQVDPVLAVVLTQLNQNNALLLEMVKSMASMKGGGGGMKPQDVIDAINVGVNLGQGKSPDDGGNSSGGIDMGDIIKIATTILASKNNAQIPTASPQPMPPQNDNGVPTPQHPKIG